MPQYGHFNNETRKHSLDIFRFSLDLGHLARVVTSVCPFDRTSHVLIRLNENIQQISTNCKQAET